MTESLIHGNRENHPNIHLVLQLEEARMGDKDRLELIKKTLNTGQELPESEKQYLEEQVEELQKAIDHQMMVEWAMDFVQELQQKVKKNFTFDEIKKSLEKEKNLYKIDKKFLKQASITQLKQTIEREKESKWALGLISQLRETKFGDTEKLNHINKLLKSGKNIEESDKQYLKKEAIHVIRVVNCKTMLTWTQDANKTLRENEMRHYKKLEEIKKTVENGKLVTERDQSYLYGRYKKLQSAVDLQNRIEWTTQTIQKLEEFGVGNSKKLDKIKELLEDEIPVLENDTKYLKEEYNLLRQMLKHKKKIDWAVGMINELQEMEVGNPERLAAIKKLLEIRRPVSEGEINYLTDKCKLLMIAKKSDKEYQTPNNENQEEESNYNFILTGLNTAVKELENYNPSFKQTELIS